MDEYIDWREQLREAEADDDDEPPEVDIAEPEIGEPEFEEPELDEPELGQAELDD
ncbi:hypothetical protein ACOZ4N_17525 [Halorientalis pallida]|uniref:hypothetical protein n=1 Tax=Halorientalis pallida TaxID=2479928 RepID=UPI003C6FF7F5